MTGQPETVDLAELRRLAEAASEGPWGNEPPSRERATVHHIIRERTTGPQVANVLLTADAAYIVALANAAPALLARIEALETALETPPSWQRATCCSFAIGSHYNRDGTVGGDLVPPHEPTIDPLSGVVMLDYRSVRALLESRG